MNRAGAKKRWRATTKRALLVCLAASLACGEDATAAPDELTLGAYSIPREAYAELLPVFTARWRERTGRALEVRASYLASGAQSRAIVGGFEADVAALSLAPDVARLVDAGLVDARWDDDAPDGDARGGMVTRSIVVIGVREGNPKDVRGWADLARDDVEVLTPNVRTSGGAMWNVLALHGAALRGHAGVPAGDRDAAIDFVASVLRRVRIMDRSGRDSMLTFARGVGDAIVTYENELLAARAAGERVEIVVPRSTILIENPVAVVRANATRHHVTEAAEALVAFLREPESQRVFARHGFRPVDDSVTEPAFPAVEDLFTVRDLGGWAGVRREVFDEGAAYDRALRRSRP